MTRKPDDWMPLHIGVYHADTTHLTRHQHGAYFLLLLAYWRRGGPLPADDGRLAAIVKATPAEWRRLRPAMAEFFSERDGLWHQKRADEELAKARRLTEAKSQAGKKGAASKWHGDGEVNDKTIAVPSNSHRQTDAPIPSPIPQPLKKVDSPSEPARPSEFVEGPENPEFIEFFFAFPKQEGGKDASKIYFAARRDKGVSRETLLDGAKRYTAHIAAAGQKLRYAQKAETWLKAECWNDRYDTEVKAPTPPVAVDPSWGDRAQKLSAAVEPKFFDAYFAAAEFVDSDPPRIRFKSRSAKELAERKCGRALKSTFGEIMLEVRA